MPWELLSNYLMTSPCFTVNPCTVFQTIPRLTVPIREQSPVWIFSWSFPAGILLRNPCSTNLAINSSHPCLVLISKDLVSALPSWSLVLALFFLLLLLTVSQEFHQWSDNVFHLLQDSLCWVWLLEEYQNLDFQGFTIRNYISRFVQFQILSLPNKALGM